MRGQMMFVLHMATIIQMQSGNITVQEQTLVELPIEHTPKYLKHLRMLTAQTDCLKQSLLDGITSSMEARGTVILLHMVQKGLSM